MFLLFLEIPDEVPETPQPCQAVKGLDELVMCTNFSREELQLMYHGFKNVREFIVFLMLSQSFLLSIKRNG